MGVARVAAREAVATVVARAEAATAAAATAAVRVVARAEAVTAVVKVAVARVVEMGRRRGRRCWRRRGGRR